MPTCRATSEPAALQFEVADTGPGIPSELLPRLFTRGARGGGAASAQGLGLYIVRRVMDMHGGSVAMQRTSPSGAVMRLTLPQAGWSGGGGPAFGPQRAVKNRVRVLR